MEISEAQLKELGVVSPPDAKWVKGKGCATCAKTGYKGRAPIFEVLDFSSTLKEMVLKGESIVQIRKQAQVEGMITLRQAGILKAMQGVTTLEEALAATME
jgi:type II secretory ATPase GspE/PulE/Tfp pilus assembly ATPase PilB-like protein